MEKEWESHAMDFQSDGPHFAFGAESQAQVARRVRENSDRNATKQAAAEAKGVPDEIERIKKDRIEKEPKQSTAAKLQEH